MRLVCVPVRDEAVDGACQHVEVSEGRVLEHAAGKDAEPDLALIDPLVPPGRSLARFFFPS